MAFQTTESDYVIVEPEEAPTDPNFDYRLKIDGMSDSEDVTSGNVVTEGGLTPENALKREEKSGGVNLIISSERIAEDKDQLSEQQINCHARLDSESVERKQYSEREITYNLLLRKLIDEFFDRTITYSHQPKNVLNALRVVLERNFPELGDSFHRERICAYLKACRRNAKKKNGEPFVRISARYLSAGMATRTAEQIYMKERENLIKLVVEETESSFFSQKKAMSEIQDESNLPVIQCCSQMPSNISTEQQFIRNFSDAAPPMSLQTLPASNPSITIPGSAEGTFAKLLVQTAEFLLLVADRLEAGHELQTILSASTTQT